MVRCMPNCPDFEGNATRADAYVFESPDMLDYTTCRDPETVNKHFRGYHIWDPVIVRAAE